jgi:hypothetical protein
MFIMYLMVQIYYEGQSNEIVGYVQISLMCLAWAAVLIPAGAGVGTWSKYI